MCDFRGKRVVVSFVSASSAYCILNNVIIAVSNVFILQTAEYAVRSIILLLAIVSINYHITQLRQRLSDIAPPITSTTAISYLELSDFEILRFGFLAYIALPMVLVVLQATILPSWEYACCNELLNHLSMFMIFVPLGSRLAPQNGIAAIVRPFRYQEPSTT